MGRDGAKNGRAVPEPPVDSPLRITAIAASAQLGGTERVLLDFAARAFEHDIALRVLTPRDGPLIAILNQLGVPAEVVPGSDAMLRGSQQPSQLVSLVPALLALPRWARELSRHRFWTDAQVIYTVAFKAHTAALLHHDRTTVWHLHEFPPALTGGVWKLLARRSPNAMIANSEAVARAWVGRSDGKTVGRSGDHATTVWPSDRPTVVPNGVNLDRFKPRERTGWIHERLGIPRGHRLIGMPAVFARWKGHELVLRAFDTVGAEFPDAHLVFVGGSIYDTVAEREFGRWLERQVRERIHILSFQPDIERVYPEFDLITHYSLRPEPFGRVILESMACGVPVIAAAEGGPLEILGLVGDGGETPEGWLVVPREATALAATLRRALGAGARRLAAKGQAGRTRAEERFSAREFARGVAHVIRSAYARSTG